MSENKLRTYYRLYSVSQLQSGLLTALLKMSVLSKVFGAVAIVATSLIPGETAEPPSTIEVVQVDELSVEELITFNAQHYGVSEEVMHTVINCESGYNPDAVGDGGQSFGLVQIHNPSHPNIEIEKSLDSAFAVDFLARNLSEGRGYLWTCWRKHYA
uniref:Transglycosylase SLT domain-containing protein n=1 Tax=uncultured marine virus TaxID=186617 RepID=A0A0F7L617_9VIRU|nr:hypothetical protein [uncultured marine virus]